MTGCLVAALLLSSRPDWSVNAHHALIWDGAPYVPVGIRVSSDPAVIQAAAAAGIRDFVVEVASDGSDWKPAIDALNTSQSRYFLSIKGAAPTAPGFVCEPDAYRIAGLTGKQKLVLPLAGASSAFCLTASQRDSRVTWARRTPCDGKNLSVEMDPASDLSQVFLAYPTIDDFRTVDYFSGFDRQRDQLLAAVKSHELGSGYRGMIDPAGTLPDIPGPDNRAVPLDPLFRTEFEAYLKDKYQSVGTALRGWRLGATSISSFGELARLAPLWSNGRGVAQLLDLDTDKIYVCDEQGSLVWQDISSMLAATARRRLSALADSVRALAPGPVMYSDHARLNTIEGPNGVAVSLAAGSVLDLSDGAAQALGSVLTRRDNIAAVVTDLAIESGGFTAQDAVAELASVGVRGVFFRTSANLSLADIASVAKPDPEMAEWSPLAIPYPVGATNPCHVSRLTSGRLWLPVQDEGVRLDFGAGVTGYWYKGLPEPFVCLWSTGTIGKLVLRTPEPIKAQVTLTDGSPVKTRVKKTELEFELGPDPVMIFGLSAPPVPAASFTETASLLGALIDKYALKVDLDNQQKFEMNNAVQSFERDPWNSFLAVRGQLRRLTAAVAPYSWASWSRSREHSFSGTGTILGSASGSVLTLKHRFSMPGRQPSAKIDISIPADGEYEVWVSGRIDRSATKELTLRIGQDPMLLADKPTSSYGDGLAWWSLGKRSFRAGSLPVEAVWSGGDVDISLDVLALMPLGYAPDGPAMDFRFLIPEKPAGKG